MIGIETNCPLCKTINLAEREKILVGDLDQKYKNYGVDSVAELLAGHATVSLVECKGCGLLFFNPMATATEKIYEQLQKHDWYYFDEKAEFDFARKFVKDTDRVLEIGSGKGAFAKGISKGLYTGLEFSKNAIEIGRAEGINIQNQLIQEHAVEAKEYYDVVCFFQVLEHVANVREFLEASASCLKKDGIMILSVPSADTFIRDKVNAVLNMPPHHVTWWTDFCLENLATIMGFEVIDRQHEVLANAHLNSYLETLLYNSLTDVVGPARALIETSFLHKFKYLIAIFGAKFLARGIRDQHMRPSGHSVTFIYRKR